MKNKKLLLIIAVIFLFGLLIYQNINKQNKISQANIAKTINTQPSQEKWTTYNSEIFGISFDYPKQWKTEEKHEEGNTYILLNTDIPDSDSIYTIWVETRNNPENQSFEDLIFPKDTYEGLYQEGIKSLYTKGEMGNLTLYKTDRLMSQATTYHYFLTNDGSKYVDFSFLNAQFYDPNHPTYNQVKILNYLDKITSTLKIR